MQTTSSSAEPRTARSTPGSPCTSPTLEADCGRENGPSHEERFRFDLGSGIRSPLRDAELAVDQSRHARFTAICAFLIAAHPGPPPVEVCPCGATDEHPAPCAELEGFVRAIPESTWIALALELDVSIFCAKRQGALALCAIHGMPDTLRQTLTSGLRFGRVEFAASLGAKLDEEKRPTFDHAVSQIPAGLEWKRYRRAVSELFLALQPPQDKEGPARRERGVTFWNNHDGTGCLQFRGPLSTIVAADRRLTAWAKGVIGAETGLFRFTDAHGRLVDGDRLSDARLFDELRFDIGLQGVPEVPLSVTHADGTEEPITLTMPTEAAWLRKQAGVAVTIPLLSLLGKSDLPARLEGESPLSAAEARRIASCAPSMRRILTDPIAGRVTEAIARYYPIPTSLRTTLIQEWIWCTVPGCSRLARTCDLDHIAPFDHDSPARGGPTQLDNLHPLCRRHHRLKTEGALGVERRGDALVWTFPAAAATVLRPPGSEADIIHADQLRALLCLWDRDDAGLVEGVGSASPVGQNRSTTTGEGVGAGATEKDASVTSGAGYGSEKPRQDELDDIPTHGPSQTSSPSSTHHTSHTPSAGHTRRPSHTRSSSRTRSTAEPYEEGGVDPQVNGSATGDQPIAPNHPRRFHTPAYREQPPIPAHPGRATPGTSKRAPGRRPRLIVRPMAAPPP